MSPVMKDERNEKINAISKSIALDFMIAATQILTVVCFVKGNSAWIGSFALLFIGGSVQLFYKFHKRADKPYLYVGTLAALVGISLLVWFGIAE